MNKEITTLRQIEELLGPKHLFILPEWADPLMLDHLLKHGYLRCLHTQRDEQGLIYLIMGMELTEAGRHLIRPAFGWLQMVARALMAFIGVAGMNLIILYWG